MRKIYRALFVVTIFHLVPVHAWSQNAPSKKYTDRAREVEQEITGVADPMFKVTTIPAAYSKASAVVIVRKVDIFSDFKSKVKFSLFFGREVTNMIRYSLTIREMVKIQDKNALNEYSEISFKKIRSQSSFFRRSSYSFTGVRLIKPNGDIKKIDADAEAVNAGSEDERNKYKLAIPGLEVGDIIDLYTRVESESSSDNPIEPLDLVLGGDYPIMKYSFNTKLRKDFAVIYTNANGAPELKQSSDDDFIYLKAEEEGINATTDAQWLYERRELPVFKITIFPGASERTANRTFAPRKGEVLQGIPKEWIDEKLRRRFAFGLSDMAGQMSLLKEYIKRTKKEKGVKELDTDSLIHCIYYFGRFMQLYDYMSENKIQIGIERNAAGTNNQFFAYLLAAFNYYDIDYDVIYTVTRESGTIQNIASEDELVAFMRAKGKQQDYYLVPPDMFTIVNSFPAVFEGQDAYVVKSVSMRSKGSGSSIEKLPFTKASFNFQSENLEISLDPAQSLALHINRIRVLRGNPSYESQVMLLLFEDYVDSERKKLGERSFADEIRMRTGKARGTQLLGEYEVAFAEARTKRLELAKKEAEEAFDNKTIIIDSIRILQTGNRHDQTDLVFTEKLSLEGLLKKAGSNYILEIGSLLGSQVQVKTEQRSRQYNVQMPYARSYDYRISLKVPAGFTVEGLDNLNNTVTNETGNFTSKATLKDDKLVIEANKTYNHYYEKKDSWEKMLAFLDAAYNFSQAKILLKKK